MTPLFDPAAMDTAAAEAKEKLKDLPKEVVSVVAKWFKDHYLKAGHKRLGRMLVAIAKAEEQEYLAQSKLSSRASEEDLE